MLRSQMWSRDVRMLIISVAVGSVACWDSSAAPRVSPPRPALQGANRSALIVAATDTTWDYLNADLTLTFDGGGFVGRSALPRRIVRLRLERYLGPDSQWASRYSFLTSPSLGSLRRPTVATAISDASGLRLFDAAGAEMDVPREIRALRPKSDGPEPSPRRVSASREWLDHIVISAANRDRFQGRLQKALGTPVTRAGRVGTYRANRGERVVEYVVNEEMGAVEEFRLYRGSAVETRVTYGYERIGDGVYLRRTARAVSSPTDTRVRETVMEIRVDSLRFERRGGQQP